MPKDIMAEQKLREMQAQNKEHMIFWSTCICVHLLNNYMQWHFCHYYRHDVKRVLEDWSLSFWISITCKWIPHTSQSKYFFLMRYSHAKLLCRGKQQWGKSSTFINQLYGRLSVLLLTVVSSHMYLTATKPHTHDKGNVHTFCLVVYSWLFLELLLMVWLRCACWRVVGWTSDLESISNPPSYAFLIQADSCKLQFRVCRAEIVSMDWKLVYASAAWIFLWDSSFSY